jgi:hypothetical protein
MRLKTFIYFYHLDLPIVKEGFTMKNQKLYRDFQDEIRKMRDETGRDPECADNYDVFFPEEFTDNETRALSVRVAKQICDRCPLIRECGYYAIEAKEQHGVWGGQTAAERLAILQNIKRLERRQGRN